MTTQEDFESYDGGDYKIFVGRVSVVVEPSELSGSFLRPLTFDQQFEQFEQVEALFFRCQVDLERSGLGSRT